VEQKGFTVWFTGLSGAGKTALAFVVEDELRARGLKVERLDGDIVRRHLTKDLGFSKEDRYKNIERVTFVAKLLSRNGVAVLCSFIAPYRDMRALSRTEIGNFVEVYCKCPLEVLIQRDIKGLYKRALAGEISDFTGISDPYEEPLNPEVVCRTDEETIGESVAKIIDKLEEMGYIPEAAPRRVYSEEEERLIEERLRDLGYM
jgi:adenylylsulfate kinase